MRACMPVLTSLHMGTRQSVVSAKKQLFYKLVEC